MSEHHFQIAYEVTDNGEDKEREKDIARDRIREHDEWSIVENISTTLVGQLSIPSGDIDYKRKEAESKVWDIFSDLLKGKEGEKDVYKDVKIYISLMVDGLGEHIEFRV